MNINFFDTITKYLFLYLSLYYCYKKIINYNGFKIIHKILLAILILSASVIQYFAQEIIPKFYIVFIIYLVFSLILSKITKIKLSKSIIITLISITIPYIFSIISFFIIGIITSLINKPNLNPSHPFVFTIIMFFTFLETYFLFSIKRFKYGFPFFNNSTNNELFEIITLVLNIIMVFMYFFIGISNSSSIIHISLTFIIFGIILLIILQKTFILYHKQKLQLKALKDYEQELSETKQKLETALSEKRNLVQSNHEFYHRQKALSQKLDELMILQAHSANTEVSEEISDIIDRINKMSDEYKTKTHTLPNLEKCNIKSIDDMFSYMQYECYKNDIEFILKYNCDINHIINNNINESQLETLLGDFIRNSIIAINHSENSYRSIMVVFGIKDDAYELCVFDSGIPFEINTLINLGLQPASTHLDEGGTGSGFISTFETINSCNASFIINEITGTNYTKSLEIKFDNKHEYIIISDRSNEIKKLNVSNRNIILK